MASQLLREGSGVAVLGGSMSGLSERAVRAGGQCLNHLRLRTKHKRIKVQGKALAGRPHARNGPGCHLGSRFGCNRRCSDGQHLTLVPCVRGLSMHWPLLFEGAQVSDNALGICRARNLGSLSRRGALGSPRTGNGKSRQLQRCWSHEAARIKLCCSASIPHHPRSALQDEVDGSAAQNAQRVTTRLEFKHGGQQTGESSVSEAGLGRRALLGLLAGTFVGSGVAEATSVDPEVCTSGGSTVQADHSPGDAEPSGRECLEERSLASAFLAFQASGIYGPTEYLFSGGSAALLPSAILLLGVCLVTPVGKELLRSMRPGSGRAVTGAALGKAATAAPSVSAAATSLEEAYNAASQVNGYKCAGPVVMESIRPTLEETRRLLRDFEGLSADMAAAGVDVEALAGKLRSLQGSLDACSDAGERMSVAAGVLAEVGAASGGEERRVAICRVLLQKNDSLRLTDPVPELDATTVAWLEQYLERARVEPATSYLNGSAPNGHAAASTPTASHSSTVEHLNRALHKPPVKHPVWKNPIDPDEEAATQPEPDDHGPNGSANGVAVEQSVKDALGAEVSAESGSSNGLLVLEEEEDQARREAPAGPSEGSSKSGAENSQNSAENGSVGSSLGGVLAEGPNEDSVSVERGKAGVTLGVAVLERPVEKEDARLMTRGGFLAEYRHCLQKRRAKECIDIIEAGQQAGLLNIKKHVSHQRVLQLCASQPDAALSVRFLKLFRAPTLTLLTSVMGVCAQKADVDRGFDVLAVAHGARVVPDCHLYTGLITTCMNARRLDLAFKVFHDMEAAGVEPNRYTFAALIHGCAEVRQVAKAFGAYSIMLKKNIKPDQAVFNSLINACGRSGVVARAFDVYGDMAIQGLKPDAITLGTLVNACAQAGELERAIEIYAGMVEGGVMPSREVYTSLVHACSKDGDVAKALAIYADMRAAGIMPDEVVFSALIDVAGHSGQLDVALYLLTEMRVAGVPIGAVTYGALIGMFGKAGMIPESERLFDQMQAEGIVPSAAIYNALIGVKGRAGHLSEALALLDDMRSRGVKPDRITYSSLLHACASKKEADQAFELYHMALAEGIPPFLTACKVLTEICANQIWSNAGAPSPATSVGPWAWEVAKQPPRTQWAYRALQVYRETVAAGVRVPVGTFSMLLGCFKLPATPGPTITSVWRASRRAPGKRSRGRQPTGEGLFTDDGAGLYSPGAVALYEEVAAKVSMPQCSMAGPATLDMTYLPPNAAEVCVLAMIKRVRLKQAAGAAAKLYPITLKLKTHLEPSPNKEMEGHMIHISSRSAIAVGSLLRRLQLRFDGHESSGSITISAASLRRWLRPPVPRGRKLNFVEQQRAIRLGQKLPQRGGPRGGTPAPRAASNASKPSWYPKIGGWQTSEGYGTAFSDDDTEDDEVN